MSKVIVKTVASKKPVEYKDYQNFLQNYKNGKKDDQISVVSSDSGVNSPSERSPVGSSISLNTDGFELDGTAKMKTEICIDITQPTQIKIQLQSNGTLQPAKVTPKPNENVIQTSNFNRRGTVRKMSKIFDQEGEKNTKINAVNSAPKPPLPSTQYHNRPSLEKSKREPDNQFPILKTNGTMSALDKLLLEDLKNSQQNIQNPENIVIPAPVLSVDSEMNKMSLQDKNDTVVMDAENIFTCIKKAELDEPDVSSPKPTPTPSAPAIEAAVIPPPPLPTNASNKPPLSPKPVINATQFPPPPPPPPMPTAVPTVKASYQGTLKPNLPKPVPLQTTDSKEIDAVLELAKRKLAYGTLRGLCDAYHDKANNYVATLPRSSVHQNKNIQNIIQSIA